MKTQQTDLEKQAAKLPQIGTVLTSENGDTLEVTLEAVNGLRMAEVQIANNLMQIAFSFKQIRDSKWYLMRSSTFKDYIENYVHYSYRHVYNYIAIAEKFSGAKDPDKLSQLPLFFLQEAGKSKEVTEQLKKGEFRDADGNIYDYDSLANLTNEQLKGELTRLKVQNKEYKDSKDKAETRLDEQQKLMQTYDEMKNSDRWVKIKQKGEVLGTLHACQAQATKLVQDLDDIETDDAEARALLASTITHVMSGMNALHDKWSELFFVPGKEYDFPDPTTIMPNGYTEGDPS